MNILNVTDEYSANYLLGVWVPQFGRDHISSRVLSRNLSGSLYKIHWQNACIAAIALFKVLWIFQTATRSRN